MSRGIVYATAGDEFVAEAVVSAESVKAQMPEMDITIFCDQEPGSDVFDRVEELENPQYAFIDKILPMMESPYDRTLYLDPDTYVCGDITGMFDLLDRFDIAARHAKIRRRHEMEHVPAAFPEHNSGVILYRNTNEVRELIQRWHDIQGEDRDGYIGDQVAFREALYESDLHIGSLPAEYNCRFPGPEYQEGETKILHGRGVDMAGMAEAVNEETTKRALTGLSDRRIFAEPKPMKVVRYPGGGRWTARIEAVKRSLREDGVRRTAAEIRERFSRLF
ncbi:MAG: hypothetical protein SVW77_01370 [Candidatus Nanohaloarchaea archaeon]|nr:hypothetical protein [Candidatus Nanohaloarchaea archaeon]